MRREDSPFFEHPDAFPLTVWRGKGIRATDGDTIAALVETAPHAWVVLDLRLSTIDTYELRSGPAEWRKLAAEAAAFTEARTAGQWLRILSVMDTEKYGRTLTAIQYQTDTGRWLDLAERLDIAGYRKPKASALGRSRHARHGMSDARAAELHRARAILRSARIALSL